MSTIHGKRVHLRPLREDDFARLQAWSVDPELADLLEGDHPRQIGEYDQWLKNVAKNRHRQTFGIAVSEQLLIGDIELDHIAWRSGDAELRIRIGEKQYWGQGYGTEAIELMLNHAFITLNLRRVYLRVFSSNKRAIASYRKTGFKKEGYIMRKTALGERRRIVLMRLLRDEFLSMYVVSPQGIPVDM